jgi:hypothetical protein
MGTASGPAPPGTDCQCTKINHYDPFLRPN